MILRRKLLSFFAFLVLAGFASYAQAHSYRLGPIEIGHAWVLSAPQGTHETKGFVPLALDTGAKEHEWLEKVESPLAGKVVMQKGSDNLSSLELEPGKPVAMREGGLHFVFLDLTQPLKPGDKLLVVLHFRNRPPFAVDFMIQAAP